MVSRAANGSMSSYTDKELPDPEAGRSSESLLVNDIVKTFAWDSISVTVKDRATKKPKLILSGINGHVKAGELLALMGPSGSGKTTLLNVLAQRAAASGATVEGNVLTNGSQTSLATFRKLNSYVEQDDALIGSLTVQETLSFAAKLALPKSFPRGHRTGLVNLLIRSFGLQEQRGTLIGTPIRKGISGGQKRRVSVASQLITGPKILFLDELTSGLDSVASYEAVSCVKRFAQANNLVVIASIHQPSTSTYQLFDKLLLLSAGQTCYHGPVNGVKNYFDGAGHHMPAMINPAEYILDTVNTDFAEDRNEARRQLGLLHEHWRVSPEAARLKEEINHFRLTQEEVRVDQQKFSLPQKMHLPLVLLHRSFIKSYRDVVAYGIRIAMYTGLAIMMGTVWLRLGSNEKAIQSYVNAIFFGSAFMSFMAVAYVPAFLEDRAIYIKERANGLYGPTAFVISNFLIGLPYLFFIAILFSVIAYWLSNFQPNGQVFFTWIMWLFLDLLAAESLVVLISAAFPIFVVSLAITAFANGLWMCVGGFLVQPDELNVFWRYVFHYIDYQSYVFQGMMVNEFTGRSYTCGENCKCMYQSPLASECRIAGQAVLDGFGYKPGNTGKWVGILMAIIFGYRLLGWLVLYLRRT